MKTIIVSLWLVLCGSIATANAQDVVVESPKVILVPSDCYVGPRTTGVILAQCGADLDCVAARIQTVCEVTQ